MSDERYRFLLGAIQNWVDPHGTDSQPDSEDIEAETVVFLRERDPYLADQLAIWLKTGRALNLRAAWLLSNLEKKS